METITMISLTVDELRELIGSAVMQALDEWQTAHKPPPPKPADQLLTRTETARLLHLTPTTLRKLEQRGELCPGRVGRRVLYRRSEVERVLGGEKMPRRGRRY